MKNAISLIYFLLVAVGFCAQAQAPSLSGSLQITHEYYQLATNSIGINPRKPTHLTRFVFTPTLQWKKFRLPVNIIISSQGTNTVTPPDKFSQAYSLFSQIKSGKDLWNYLQNPINRVGVSPQIKSFQAFLGTHTPVYSPLTQGNISLFGAGFMWKPKGFFLGANYGISQHAIAADINKGIQGAYKRAQQSLRMGFGNSQKTYLAFNVLNGRDVWDSLQPVIQGVKPQQSTAASADMRIAFGKKVAWGAELAAGLLTQDLSAPLVDLKQATGFEVPSQVKYYLSSRADAAASSFFEVKNKYWGINAKMTYVGAGYKTFGYPFFQSDRFEWTVSPKFSLWKNKVNFAGSLGRRTNNLSGTKAAPMSQLLANANLSMQAAKWLFINTSYSNFGIRNVVENDTLKIENVSQNFSFTPVMNFDRKKSVQVVTGIFSIDNFQDYNVVTGAANQNQSLIAGANYQYSFKEKPFTLGANLMHFQLYTPQIQVNNNSLGTTLSYAFFKKRLQSSVNLSYLLNRPQANVTQDKQFLVNVQVNYQHEKGFFVNLQGGNNGYSYGSLRPNTRLNETNVRIAAGKKF